MSKLKIYYNCTILTMDSNYTGDCIVVDQDIIKHVGNYKLLSKRYPEAEQINLNKQTIMPAFIDAHSHFTQTATSFLQVSLSNAHTDDELIQTIQNYIHSQNIDKGQWIIARDYDHNQFSSKKHPSLNVLDQASPNNPLIIQHQSGHLGLMNSIGLQSMNITSETPVPDGGKIEQINGQLTGLLEENALFIYLKQLPGPNAQQLINAYKKAQDLYLSYGIKTIQDGMFVKEMIPLYKLLLHANILKTDIVIYPDIETYQLLKTELPELSTKNYYQHIRIGGIKIFLDGSPQGKTAWMKTPYCGTNSCGYGTMTDEEVIHAFRFAAEEKIQILAHCNGDAAAQQFLDCLEIVENDYPNLKFLHPVIIHGQLLSEDQLPKVKTLGVFVSYFVAHVYHWGDIHIENFGYERAAQISPAATSIHMGIPITFHQDTPVIQPDMLETIWCAVCRTTKSGTILGKNESISPYNAFLAVTKNAAKQYFEDSKKGSITPGKKADIMILDQNPFAISANNLKDIKITGIL